MSPLDVVRRYYDGCSAGDVEEMRATLTDDVVHYFLAPNPGSAPVRGGEHLARYWRKVAGMIEARWVVDHGLVGSADPVEADPVEADPVEADPVEADPVEAVIEWTMFWRPRGATSRVATRGAEWFAFAADGRIAEIRSYYQQQPNTTELVGFPYAARGYSTGE